LRTFQKEELPEIAFFRGLPRSMTFSIETSDMYMIRRLRKGTPLQLKEFMDARYSNVLEAIRATGKLESETEELLKTALTELVADFTAGN
jgi:hypothetical protein